jgi:outer membrane protein assembly factor BamE
VLLALGAAATGGGCVYRPNIQQGNLLKTTDVDQVTVGMTRSQVRYLLGTPMIADPFNPERWDYVYSMTRGRDPKPNRAHFIVYFADDKVTKVDRLGDLPEPKANETKPVTETAHEPPAPPPVEQRQPGAPRPGGNNR